MIWLTELSWVSKRSAVEWAGRWAARGLLQFSRCEPLLLEAGSSDMLIVQEPRGNGMFDVGNRYQATAAKTWLWTLLCVKQCTVEYSHTLYQNVQTPYIVTQSRGNMYEGHNTIFENRVALIYHLSSYDIFPSTVPLIIIRLFFSQHVSAVHGLHHVSLIR
jgi:hypothetical protein